MVSLRLFVSFDTPEEVKRLALEGIDLLRTAGADVSWERPEKLHCTVKFLGDTPVDLLPAVAGALKDALAGVPIFPVRYSGYGVFPERRNPRIVWIGITDEQGVLEHLYGRIEEGMAALGFRRENRAFHPHLTLGRVRSPRNARRLIEILETRILHSDVFEIQTIELMNSTLKPSGSVYEVRESIPLLGNRGGRT